MATDEEVSALKSELDKLNKELATARKTKATDDDKDELDNISQEAQETKAKAKRVVIQGASESSVHALLDEVRQLRAELSGWSGKLGFSLDGGKKKSEATTSEPQEKKSKGLFDGLFFGDDD
jgi:hypothetical protein